MGRPIRRRWLSSPEGTYTCTITAFNAVQVSKPAAYSTTEEILWNSQ